MQIICRKRLHFQEHEIVDNSKTGEKIAILKRQLVVSPSVHPQVVPDFVTNDDLFRLCVEDGTITIVRVLSTPKTKSKAKVEPASSTEPAEAKETKEPDPNSGWGAKPGAGLPNGNDIGGNSTS